MNESASTVGIVAIIYLHGIVLWTILVYLALKGKKVKNFEIISLIIGVLWGFFVPYNIVKIILEKRHAKNNHR